MAPAFKKVTLLFLLSLLCSAAWAQKTVRGTVKDAKTGKALPGTNIVIEHTYRGTITNRDGHYSLSIPQSLLPATIKISFIGYNSQKRLIKSTSRPEQNFSLSPSISHLKEVVVTDIDPGLSIMERVIKRKQMWRKKLHTYKADAYTRQTLASDTTLAMITETTSTSYWDEKKGHREIIKSRKQTANVKAAENLTGARYIPNFYDDNVDMLGFDMVGVTNPKALKYYDFKLLGQTSRDGQTVYKIKVIPKRSLQPLFKGTVYILDKAYAMIKAQLTPNKVIKFPPPIKSFSSTYEQQYNNFGKKFWLPVDMRLTGTVKIGIPGLQFPRMKLRYISRLNNYKVNIPLPDSLYHNKNEEVRIDSTSIHNDSLVTASIKPIPLSKKEQRAYATIDSSQSLEKVFKPHGFFARFIDFSNNASDERKNQTKKSSPDSSATTFQHIRNHIPGNFVPHIRYNRVEGLWGNLAYRLHPVSGLQLEVKGGYATAEKKFSYGGGARYKRYRGRFHPVFQASYQVEDRPRYGSQTITPVIASVSNVLGYENYFDYFRQKGFHFAAGVFDARTDLSLRAGFKTVEQQSLQTNTAYDILGQNSTPRINPSIKKGRLNALELKAGYNVNENYKYGVVGQKNAAIDIIYSDPALGSDFNFTSYAAHVKWSFDTFFKRRLFPNTLNVSVDAGTFSGNLPSQNFGIVDVAPNIVSFFGGLRATRFQPYEGEQYVALNAEHNFRTVPFELLGLRPLVKRNIGLIVFGGVAKTRVGSQHQQQIFNRTGQFPNTTGGTYGEAGISLNGIFDLFRLDFAKRIDQPAFLISIGITRFR